ncbi:2-isopropylmalate synthase [Candidatus Uabimicrobium sp. HlEnr_7]|uniref:homocitrate synthase/isopropylmalate synthase family protein n=1 Tax=Candidatus Uabimicrobium helgolandensis TaxID=3095367 RepID=UPI003556177A
MVKILDATLREGEQTPGVYFEGHNKLAIAEKLDNIGVDIIEAGHPLISKNIYKAVKQIANMGLKAKIAAHSRSTKKDVDTALDCGVDFLGIFYCVSNARLDGVFKKDISYAVDQITKIIAYAREQQPDLTIRYTPEDTVRSNFDNVAQVAVAAVKAGADIISIADTTGYMIPGTDRSMYDFVVKLKAVFTKENLSPQIAVHCHNDRGLALANAIDGYRAGADIIDCTVLGIGERAGIVDLAQLLVLLREDFEIKTDWDLLRLSNLYEFVSEYADITIAKNLPIIGKNAFTHCAGVHTHAAVMNPIHYHSLAPEVVGRKMEICLDHMSGISSVKYGLKRIGMEDISDSFTMQVLHEVKSIGETGRTVNDLKELERIALWCKQNVEDTL